MNFDPSIFWEYLLRPSSVYLNGLWLTLSISVIAQALGTLLGLFLALATISRYRSLSVPARFFVWAFRGTPLLVQIVFIYTGLAAAGLYRFEDIDLGMATLPGNIQAGVLALTLNAAAYMAEIIRAGISSVGVGQAEASKSLGMTYPLYMRRIILPQAARVVIPPLGNEFNAMLKNTTLLSVIGVPELLLATQMVTTVTFRVFELYLVVACYFLTLTTLWGFIQVRIERRYGDPAARAAYKQSGSIYRRIFGFGAAKEPR